LHPLKPCDFAVVPITRKIYPLEKVQIIREYSSKARKMLEEDLEEADPCVLQNDTINSK